MPTQFSRTLTFNRGLAAPGGSQTPFQRTVEPSALGLFVNLEQRDMQRLRRYEEHWRMYLGQQWSFTREDGEPLVTVNKLQKIVNDGLSWLVGGGFTLAIPESLADVVTPHLTEVWDETNQRQVVLEDIALMGGVCGDVWILVTPVPKTVATARAFPHIETLIKIHVLGSESVFPVWDPLNPDRMIAVKVVTLYVDDTAALSNDAHRVGGQINTTRFTQIFFDDRIVEQREGEEARELPNPLGEIPIVHIRNLRIPREYYGLSDLDFNLVDLQRELNEKATDVSDTINYHAHPITIIQGAKVKNLDRGPKKVWSGLPADAKVYNLEMGSALDPALRYMDKVEGWLGELSDQPKPPQGQAPSGIAAEMVYFPTLQRAKRKKANYERGIQEVNYLVLRYKQELDDLALPENFCKHCGGLIVEVGIKDRASGNLLRRRNGRPVTKKRCFHADPHTGLLTDPEDMKIRFVRQFSYGAEVQEIERWRMVAAMLNRRGSFWDPVGEAKIKGEVQTTESLGKALKREETTLRDPSSPPRFTDEELLLGTARLPEGAIQVPPEPESISLLIERVLPDGSPQLDESGQPIRDIQERMVVPTGCERPEVFNPLMIPVSLNSALPHDEHREGTLAVQMVTARLWSRKHALRRQQNPGSKVENIDKMLEEIEGDIATDPNRSGSASGQRGDDIPMTPLQGTEGERAASLGSPNVPTPPEFPLPGKNQGET